MEIEPHVATTLPSTDPDIVQYVANAPKMLLQERMSGK